MAVLVARPYAGRGRRATSGHAGKPPARRGPAHGCRQSSRTHGRVVSVSAMTPSHAPAVDLEAWVARSGALDLSAIAWDQVDRYPLPAGAVRALRYMQDIESHTVVYLRELLATRAIEDPDVATFLACWLYEETFHGIALARFLEAAGAPVGLRERPRGREPFVKRLDASAVAALSGVWPDFWPCT